MRFAEFGSDSYQQIVASAAVTNTVTETTFDHSYTIPAGAILAGDRFNIRTLVRATAQNSTDTLNVKLYVGSQVIAQTGAVDVGTDDVGLIDADVVVRTTGASGTYIVTGWTSLGASGTATAKVLHLASTAIDTTATQLIKVTATWSVANAGNSCRMEQLSVARKVAFQKV